MRYNYFLTNVQIVLGFLEFLSPFLQFLVLIIQAVVSADVKQEQYGEGHATPNEKSNRQDIGWGN